MQLRFVLPWWASDQDMIPQHLPDILWASANLKDDAPDVLSVVPAIMVSSGHVAFQSPGCSGAASGAPVSTPKGASAGCGGKRAAFSRKCISQGIGQFFSLNFVTRSQTIFAKMTDMVQCIKVLTHAIGHHSDFLIFWAVIWVGQTNLELLDAHISESKIWPPQWWVTSVTWAFVWLAFPSQQTLKLNRTWWQPGNSSNLQRSFLACGAMQTAFRLQTWTWMPR